MLSGAAAIVATIGLTLVPVANVSVASAAEGSSITKPAPAGGSVTVEETTNLVAQTVHVTWQGFRPSSETVLHDTTQFPVRVFQCRGEDPADWTDCYGAPGYTYSGRNPENNPFVDVPDGPANYVSTVTAKDGTGQADIGVFTKQQSSTLDCTSTTVCSIVVVPVIGLPKGQDFITAIYDAAVWANRVSIPVQFAPTGALCGLGDADASVLGAPIDQRMVTQWQPALCTRTPKVNVDYTADGEPQARAQFTQKHVDIGLTTLPLQDTGPPQPPHAYAPVSVSGIAIAFRVDDPNTGRPITSMKLNPRLVAKLITQSYGGVGYVPKGNPVGSGDPNTAGNPQSIFTDPEFLALNPGISWPFVGQSTPLLMADNSDVTWELTRWIASDPDAKAFVAGTADPWGMQVNAKYKGVQFPESAFQLRDDYVPFTYEWAPVQGLSAVARNLVVNQPPGVNYQAGPDGSHAKNPQEPIGGRDLIAIIDTPDSAAYDFPVAALKNAHGDFVQPTNDAMSAALAPMTVNKDGVTRQVNFTSSDSGAYPLTLVQNAVAPTSGLSAAKAAKIADFLRFAAGPGQTTGTQPGQLPLGYVPLPSNLAALNAAAATAVANQVGNTDVSGRHESSGGSGGTSSGSSSGGGDLGGGSGGSVPGSSTGANSVTSANAPAGGSSSSTSVTPGPEVAAPQVFHITPTDTGPAQWLLPVLLVIGAIAAVAGSLLLLFGGRMRGHLAWLRPAAGRSTPAMTQS